MNSYQETQYIFDNLGRSYLEHQKLKKNEHFACMEEFKKQRNNSELADRIINIIKEQSKIWDKYMVALNEYLSAWENWQNVQPDEGKIIFDDKVEISQEYMGIVIRVNDVTISTTREYPFVWPESGSVEKVGGKCGLFGILIDDELFLEHSKFLSSIGLLAKIPHYQYYGFIEQYSPSLETPTFMILQIDRRTETPGSMIHNEVEFRKCNILFSGAIIPFLDKIKEYTSSEQYARIKNIISRQ